MKKKGLYWILGILGACILTAGVAYGVKYAMDGRTDKTSNEVATETKVEEAEVKQQLEKTDMTESAVIDMMHKMTHQKVKADQKWGAIPMSVENATKVRDAIKASDFKNKVALLEIAERWVQRDFSKVDQDHNYFWKIQGGTIGKAEGILSKTEELKFARRNYEDQIVQKLLEVGDLVEK
ncbi:DUF6241 domain-containing protein [Priestia taiwanensis]|uniref:Uncharacterized protein n=1 Tax=Priestia taiwanensis TaxID=1347902 RepID=A0A917EPW4_9BACI|nr:DUF6241 domain-containing protein [Priestia taiwanensis]MBM7362675.1 hypothetical protein [Priestia taiwanensis]GGE64132.1 hypothetical protein GCM10007140_13000 [Priestia taiwanensis]